MLRVNKNNPCYICGRTDGCLITGDGKAALCSRVKNGAIKLIGEPFGGGWLHILDEKYVSKPYVAPEYPPIDWTKFADDYYACGYDSANTFLVELAKEWNVSLTTLDNLYVGWDGKAYTIPMRDEKGEIIGIHRRFPNGGKCAVSGSKNGLFYDSHNSVQPELIIVEGASDCATLLDLGFFAIGRPNCSGGTKYIEEFIENNPTIKKTLIVGDNDRVGEDGAWKLFCSINIASTAVVNPPIEFKDVREWRQKDPNIKGTMEEWLRKL